MFPKQKPKKKDKTPKPKEKKTNPQNKKKGKRKKEKTFFLFCFQRLPELFCVCKIEWIMTLSFGTLPPTV
jgi:hypothetical protein